MLVKDRQMPRCGEQDALRLGVTLAVQAILVLAGICSFKGAAGANAGASNVCEESVVIEATAREAASAARSADETRTVAVRRALIDAMQRGAGVEVASSRKSVTTATMRSVKQSTNEKTVIRSRGQIKDWTIVSEDLLIDPTGERVTVVKIEAEVCLSDSFRPPLVVAFGEVILPEPYRRLQHRGQLADAFPLSERLRPTMAEPAGTYYDILVAAEATVDVDTIDNTESIKILKRLRGDAGGGSLPPGFKVVKITAIARGVRFFDDMEILEVVERRRQVGLQVDPTQATNDLIVEALIEAARQLHSRILNGDLS